MLDLVNIEKKHLISLFKIDNASKDYKDNKINFGIRGNWKKNL